VEVSRVLCVVKAPIFKLLPPSWIYVVATPNYIVYNSAFFGLLYEALPASLVATILVWTGLLSIKGKRIVLRIGSAILTGVVSSVLIYNLAGVIWQWSR